MASKPAKKKPAAKAAKPKEQEYKHKTVNPLQGFHGHMYRRYKGDNKKAQSAYGAVAKNITDWCKLKGKEYMAGHFLDSNYGRFLGKNHKDKAHVQKLFKRFVEAGYHPNNFTVEEGTEMAGNEIKEGKYSHLPYDKKPFHTRGTALRTAIKKSLVGDDTAHVPAAASAAAGAAYGAVSGAGALPMAAACGAAAYGFDIRAKYKHLRQTRQESADEFIQDLIDAGATEEDIQLITEEPNMELHSSFLEAILEEKPLDATEIFKELMQQKLFENIEAHKVSVATVLFNGGEEDEDEEELDEEDELDLSDEELAELEEALDELTDEELEELVNSYEEEELEDEGEEVVEDDETPLH